MKKFIGILGYSGTIGRYVTERLLASGFEILGGQRHESEAYRGSANFSYQPVDVNDRTGLDHFCSCCHLVINCISPSYIYGSSIAESAALQDATYLDLSDVLLHQEKLPQNGRYVIASGYVPGLSSFLPKAISEREFDQVDQLIIYQGGTELCSEAAFADIALSAKDSGYGDAYYCEGKLLPCRVSSQKKYTMPDFSDEMLLKANVSKEMIALLESCGIQKMYWFNAFDDFSRLKLLMQAVGYSLEPDKQAALAKIKQVFNTYTAALPTTKQPGYAVLGLEMSGHKNGIEKMIRCGLYLNNSARICGYVLAQTAIEIVQREITPGLHFAYEYLSEKSIKLIEDELEQQEYFYIREIAKEEALKLEGIL